MERHNLLNQTDRSLITRLRDFVKQYSQSKEGDPSLQQLRTAFCGYHTDVLSSLAQSLRGACVEGKGLLVFDRK